MGIGRILLSPQHFFHTPNLLQLPLNHPPCCPPTHTHLHTSPQGCFVHHWNVCVELTQSAPCAPCQNTKSLHMHTGPRGPLLFGLCVDRKSTRLNSSHTVISYAVFCLKKKNKT